MKKRILFVHNALWIGGIETALVAMLNRFDYSEYDVTCLITTNNTDFASQITPKCKLIIADRNASVTFSKKYKFGKLYDIIESAERSTGWKFLRNKLVSIFFRNIEEYMYAVYIKKNLKVSDYDDVIIFSSKVAGIAKRCVNASKYISFYHYSDLRRVYHDSYGYGASEKILAVTENLAEKLREFMPKYKNKFMALHNMVDTESILKKSCESENSLELSDGFNIVSCGRLHRDKGFDMAIEACRKLIDDGYENLHWYVVGEGPERERLWQKVNEYEVSAHFHFLGVKENPYPYMKAADIFVQTSRIEAFGLTITEALTLGTPVVSTATDGGKEIITHKVNGFLCDVSSESIYSAVKTLITDDELRNKIAAGAAEIDFEAQNAEILNKLYSLL